MAPRGGYREPNNPAPVSGPGAFSKRTDGGPTQPARYISGLPYGQGQETMQQQQSAPMAGAPTNAPAAPPIMLEPPTPLFAPTTRPNEPITAGVDIGAGPGSEAKGIMPNKAYTLTEVFRNLIPYDPSGDAELVYRQLLDEGY